MEQLEQTQAFLTTDCVCSDAENESIECYGFCYSESLHFVEELLDTWRVANGASQNATIRIDGTSIGWQHRSGYKVTDFADLVDSLTIRGAEYRLKFILEGAELLVKRYSHDEPTGARFEISFVPDELSLVE